VVGRLTFAAVLALAGVGAHAREVVFLLGADAQGKRPFFAPASDYYRMHAPDGQLVDSARSLAEVHEYLVRHRDAKAWRRITLVAHGAPWVGMEVPVFAAGSGHADLESLQSAHATGEFPPLPAGVIDATSQLVVESCGLGRRADILHALGDLFSSADGSRMQVSSPAGFVAYQSGQGASRRFELEFAHAIVPLRHERGSRNALQAAAVRLRSGLGIRGVAAVEDIHPVNITINTSSTTAVVRANLRRILQADPSVRRRLMAHGLRLDDLEWRVRPAKRPDAPALVEGRAEMVVVREALPAF
jgi:hypothetical protein